MLTQQPTTQSLSTVNVAAMAETESQSNGNPTSKAGRREYLRRKKAESRARLAKVEGGVTLTVRLNREQHDFLMACMEMQRGPIVNFVQRALLTGAAFVANSGNPRGKKVRGNVAVGLPKISRKGAR